MTTLPKLPPIADQPLSVVLLAEPGGEHAETVVASLAPSWVSPYAVPP